MRNLCKLGRLSFIRSNCQNKTSYLKKAVKRAASLCNNHNKKSDLKSQRMKISESHCNIGGLNHYSIVNTQCKGTGIIVILIKYEYTQKHNDATCYMKEITSKAKCKKAYPRMEKFHTCTSDVFTCFPKGLSG